MSVKISLNQALQIWEHENKNDSVEGPHPNMDWLRKFVRGETIQNKDKLLNHLVQCHKCRERWFELTFENDVSCQHSDILLPKIASGKGAGINSVTKINSESGKYGITFRKNLEEPDSCLVTLKVLFDNDQLEHKHVTVRDKNHKVLLTGHIVQGEVSAWLDQLEEIDITSISVIPGHAEDE